MPTILRCPSCTTMLKMPENFQGRVVRCGRCQAIVPVAASPEAIVAQTPAPKAAPPKVMTEPAKVQVLSDQQADVRIERPSKPAVLSEPVPVKKAIPRRSSRRLGCVIGGVATLGLLVLAAIFLIGWLIVRGVNPSAPVIPVDKWQALEVPNRVKALLPGPAPRTTLPAAGLTMVMHTHELDRKAVYAVGYSEGQLPAHRLALSAEVLLNDACNGSAANLRAQGGEEIGRQSVQLGPHPGKELIFRLGGPNGRMITRTYLAHGRLYMVMAGGNGLDADHENVKRLFDSFQILEAPPQPAKPQQAKPENVRPDPNLPPARTKESPPPRKSLSEPQGLAVRPVAALAGALAEIVLPPDAGAVLGVAYSPDGRTLVVATAAEQAFFYDADSRTLLARTPERKDRKGGPLANGCAIAPRADKVAFLQHGGSLVLIERANLEDEIVLSTGQGNGFAHHKAAFSPDGRFLATDFGHSLRVWDVAERRMVRELNVVGNLLGFVAFTHDGSLLAATGGDIHLLDPTSYKEVSKIKGPGPAFFPALAFSPDDKLVAGGNDRAVFIWSLKREGDQVTTANPRVFRYVTGRVIAVAFGPGGRVLVAAGEEQQIKYFNAANGRSLGFVNLHQPGLGAAISLAIRTSDRQLAAACGGRVLFFELPDLKEK